MSRSIKSVNKLKLYFQTVRYLKPIQIIGRIWFRIYRPRPDFSVTPSLHSCHNQWIPPVPKKTSMLSATRFRFLNDEHDCCVPSDWNNPVYPKLWLYNLHYFDYLNATASDQRECSDDALVKAEGLKLIDRWIEENPPAMGNGWDPYTLSLRIVNWIKYHFAGFKLSEKQLDSLAVQIRFLIKRLEYYLLGNHLLANAKALVFAGLFFEGREADQWLQRGLQIYIRELPEQILADGANFELSPMYHSIILEDFLDVWNIWQCYNEKSIERSKEFDSELAGLFSKINFPEKINAMLRWLSAMCHPDKKISLFNDAAFGIAPELDDLIDYADRLKLSGMPAMEKGIVHLAESGYVRMQNDTVTLFADVGEVGPSYLPAHAHADTLSFELSYGTQRVFVDSGTSCYGTGNKRLQQRKTFAHNTVVVDGADSSEVWKGHRVARRAHVSGVSVKQSRDVMVTEASHDGFCRLLGVQLHTRRWELNKKSLMIDDCISGCGSHQIEVAFYLHPDIRAEMSVSNSVILKNTEKELIGYMRFSNELNIEVVTSTYNPEFGLSLPNQCIRGRLQVALPVKFSTEIIFEMASDAAFQQKKVV